MAKRPVQVIARRQLDERLAAIRAAGGLFERPRRGWIATLRRALGMPQSRLAHQLQVSRQAISQLEKREVDGSITLSALEQAAEALGISLRSAERSWTYARTWLHRELRKGDSRFLA